MLNAIKTGATEAIAQGVHSSKSILARGCDPVMAARSVTMLPPLLGGVEMVACTDDVEFTRLLQARKFTAIFFAPGACRFSAAKQVIPGGNDATRGWGLEEYRALVREHQGEDVPIVETTQESQIVPLLAKVLAASSATADDSDTSQASKDQKGDDL